jgi:hypothetical protein
MPFSVTSTETSSNLRTLQLEMIYKYPSWLPKCVNKFEHAYCRLISKDLHQELLVHRNTRALTLPFNCTTLILTALLTAVTQSPS